MQINFDASQVAPSQPFVPLDAGWYTVKIIEQEQKPTKDNAQTGSWYLKLTLEVVGGQHNGRKLFHNLNLKNANDVAQRIAWEQLSAICHAVNMIQIDDTRRLNGLPMMAKVSVRTDPTGQYEPQNDIKGFKPLEGNGPTSMGGGSAGPSAGFGGNGASNGPAAGFGGGAGAATQQGGGFGNAQPPANGGGFQAAPPAAGGFGTAQPPAAAAPAAAQEAVTGKAPWEQ